MAAPATRWQRLRKPLITLLVLTPVLLGAHALRKEAGIEWSASSIQQAVGELGLLAPIAYLLLVMFRQAMVLPSVVVLTAAGLLFGAPLGALLGGLGIILNAFALFASARLLGRDWALPRVHARFPDFEQRARTAGPLVIAFMTAHPMGVLTPFHFAAGITGISWVGFLVAVGPAALVRAGCYSFLGANLLDPGSPGLWVASGILLVAALLPLAHPTLRSRLLRGRSSRPENGAENADAVIVSAP